MSGGDTTQTHLLTPDGESTTEQSNHLSRVHLGEPMSFYWSYKPKSGKGVTSRSIGDSESQPHHQKAQLHVCDSSRRPGSWSLGTACSGDFSRHISAGQTPSPTSHSKQEFTLSIKQGRGLEILAGLCFSKPVYLLSLVSLSLPPGGSVSVWSKLPFSEHNENTIK